MQRNRPGRLRNGSCQGKGRTPLEVVLLDRNFCTVAGGEHGSSVWERIGARERAQEMHLAAVNPFHAAEGVGSSRRGPAARTCGERRSTPAEQLSGGGRPWRDGGGSKSHREDDGMLGLLASSPERPRDGKLEASMLADGDAAVGGVESRPWLGTSWKKLETTKSPMSRIAPGRRARRGDVVGWPWSEFFSDDEELRGGSVSLPCLSWSEAERWRQEVDKALHPGEFSWRRISKGKQRGAAAGMEWRGD
jgi:hypothetical protein